MASSTLIETHAEGAEIYHGKSICNEKSLKLLEDFSVPKGVLVLDDLDEFGFNRNTGFFWMKRNQTTEKKIDGLGTIFYEEEVSAFIEPRHLSKVTGFKGKESFFTIAINDIRVGEPSSDEMKFTTAIGISRATPISVFED